MSDAPSQGRIATASGGGAWATVRRGLSLSPEILVGIRVTLGLAAVSTLGRIIVPVGVQQTVDDGLHPLARPGQRPRGERRGRQPAQPGVVGRVELQQ